MSRILRVQTFLLKENIYCFQSKKMFFSLLFMKNDLTSLGPELNLRRSEQVQVW